MPKYVIELLAVAALLLAIICMVAPQATIIANEVSGEIYGIGFASQPGNDVDEVSAQKYARKH